MLPLYGKPYSGTSEVQGLARLTSLCSRQAETTAASEARNRTGGIRVDSENGSRYAFSHGVTRATRNSFHPMNAAPFLSDESDNADPPPWSDYQAV